MGKILGLDLGTNSIGLAVRNLDKEDLLKNQLEYFTSIIFPSGVGKDKTGEFSFAAQRTKYRSTRRLYQSRKYRLWATLKLLIENGYCPLSMEDLEKWSKYDKEKGLKREYPVNATEFEKWIRLDFNGDGVADYSSPYQLRAELMNRQFDFNNQVERYKLGRALYHIAQRRGFKSSKGTSLKDLKEDNISVSEEDDMSTVLQKSEEQKSSKIKIYMEEHNLPTVGCALYELEKSKERIRCSEYQVVRSQYRDEIKCIFNFQRGIDINSDFCRRILSEKKNEGTIFYKRPLRSQKGLVGKCTLETNKYRCPITHPSFEKFRAWCFINNIRYKESEKGDNLPLSLEIKQDLYNEVFLTHKNDFDFKVIREWLKKRLASQLSSVLSYENKTINYKDKTNVSACTISSRLKDLLGDDWESVQIKSDRTRGQNNHTIIYDYKSIWNVCYSSEELEFVIDFAKNKLLLQEDKQTIVKRLWSDIAGRQGYSALSVKAIDNINRFLVKGLMYTDSVLLAKLPDIFGEKWNDEVENDLISSISQIIDENRLQKEIYSIVNKLIANYKSLGYNKDTKVNERFAEHNYNYILQESDVNDINKCLDEEYNGKKISNGERQVIFDLVKGYYQEFFASKERDYYKLPRLSDTLSLYLSDNYSEINADKFSKLYHPSMMYIYKEAGFTNLKDGRSFRLLGSPVIGAIKNPMAMRVLHTLRRKVNQLIIDGIIDEDTRVVVETAREFNDANMRWAIEQYQRNKEDQNKKIISVLKEYFHLGNDGIVPDDDIDKVRLLLEQNDKINENIKEKESNFLNITKKDIEKYALWLEQDCRCIYTGKVISLTDLFAENKCDIEHTIPRSISFDDSLVNKTICDSYYNRNIKKNQIPTQLPNYEIKSSEYGSIKERIQPWIDRVELIKNNIEYWKKKSKNAGDKESKDIAIRQQHMWRFELEYWSNKVKTFTIMSDELDDKFRNNQLNDTRIITKYAYHFLKTVFNSVEVQKGNITAEFRKIAGIQDYGVKKDRSLHSHHAIDATVLTIIPSSVKRDNLIELYYKYLESKNSANVNIQKVKEFKNLKESIIPKDTPEISQFINDNIFVDHVKRDVALIPSKRKARIRGKEVILSNGKNKWLSGNTIRGQIHGESYFGAIHCFKRDQENKVLLDKNGEQIIDTKYVIRRVLKYKKNSSDIGFSNWDELEKAIVNKDLVAMMKKQYPENTPLQKVLEGGVYMLNKYGNRVGNKIRHIRCFTSETNPLKLKLQTYQSKYDHKNNYYVHMGDLFAMCKYVNKEDDKEKVEFRVLSLYDVVQNRKLRLEDIPNHISIKDKIYTLSLVLKKGDMVLLYKDNVDELKELDRKELSKRFYEIVSFEGEKGISLIQSDCAKSYSELGKGSSLKNFELIDKLRCSVSTLNYLVRGIDFELTTDGNIKFLW
ncbi:MAG: type II CRISPR RNA-guided endonuclease Cas9 [Bacilli bacterium]